MTPVESASAVWLPRGFSFLSGYPTAVRKRKLLLTLQVIVDDSGGPNQTFQVFAGLIGQAEDFARLADRWQSCLDQSPRVHYFHMIEAVGKNDQFYGFSNKDRDKKLRALARIMADPSLGLQLIHVAVEIEAFNDLIKPLSGVHKRFKSPYFHAFQVMLMAASCETERIGLRERFEIIFDEHKSEGHKAKAFYPQLRTLMPTYQDLMPVEPQFRDDKEFLPLQAADMTAWLWRKDLALENHGVGWLQTEFQKMPVCPLSMVIRRNDFQEVLTEIASGVVPVDPQQILWAFGRKSLERIASLDPVHAFALAWAKGKRVYGPE